MWYDILTRCFCHKSNTFPKISLTSAAPRKMSWFPSSWCFIPPLAPGFRSFRRSTVAAWSYRIAPAACRPWLQACDQAGRKFGCDFWRDGYGWRRFSNTRGACVFIFWCVCVFLIRLWWGWFGGMVFDSAFDIGKIAERFAEVLAPDEGHWNAIKGYLLQIFSYFFHLQKASTYRK